MYGKLSFMMLTIAAVMLAPNLCDPGAFGQTSTEPGSPSSVQQESRQRQFAEHLGKASEGDFSVSGDHDQILEATVPAAVDTVALLANRLGAQLYENGFEQLHIILPNGRDGTDQWRAEIGPRGYAEVRSTIFCDKADTKGKNPPLCLSPHSKSLDDSVRVPQSSQPASGGAEDKNRIPNTPEAREQLARALTDRAWKEGRHTTFSVCGQNGAKDSLCVVDMNAPEDGYIDFIAKNGGLAQDYYAVGFRYLFINNKRGAVWGFNINQDRFSRYDPGKASMQMPSPHGSTPAFERTAWQVKSGDDAAAILNEERTKALETAKQIIDQKRHTTEDAQEQALIKRGPPPGTTVYRGLYVGEPVRAVDMKAHNCFFDYGAAMNSLIRERYPFSCVILSDDGKTVSTLGVFEAVPVKVLEKRLSAQFGPPLPGKYRLLSGENYPQWTMWQRKDGTVIAIKWGSGRDVQRGGPEITFTQIAITRK